MFKTDKIGTAVRVLHSDGAFVKAFYGQDAQAKAEAYIRAATKENANRPKGDESDAIGEQYK